MSGMSTPPIDTADIDPSGAGFDPDRLQAVDRFIKTNYLDTGRYPGFSLVVSRRGKLAHLSHQGYDEDAIFRLYSMTKPLTSIALLGLMEQGLFKLGDPVSDFIPSFADLRVFEDGSATSYTTTFPERQMTVRDLLTHTSGLTYGWMHRHPVDDMYREHGIGGGQQTLEETCDQLAEVPLLFSPGTEWSYSVATDVCGRLIEILSGQQLDHYLTANILSPLRMEDTAFSVPDDKAARLTPSYALASLSPFGVPDAAASDSVVNDETVMIDPGSDKSPYRSKPTYLSGGGGLVGTLADYYRFTQMLLNGGILDGNRVIGRKTLEYATINHLPNGGDLASMGQPVFSETNYEGIGFGLGFAVTLDPARAQVMSSAGDHFWGGAASTTFWVDPVEDLTVIGMTQLMPSSAYPVRAELRNLIYGALT